MIIITYHDKYYVKYIVQPARAGGAGGPGAHDPAHTRQYAGPPLQTSRCFIIFHMLYYDLCMYYIKHISVWYFSMPILVHRPFLSLSLSLPSLSVSVSPDSPPRAPNS